MHLLLKLCVRWLFTELSLLKGLKCCFDIIDLLQRVNLFLSRPLAVLLCVCACVCSLSWTLLSAPSLERPACQCPPLYLKVYAMILPEPVTVRFSGNNSEQTGIYGQFQDTIQ